MEQLLPTSSTEEVELKHYLVGFDDDGNAVTIEIDQDSVAQDTEYSDNPAGN